MPRHIRKGDLVIVTAGDDAWIKDYDAQGNLISRRRDLTPRKVLRVITKRDRVLVEGVNIHTKHMKATQTSQGGVVQRELPIHLSNISPISDGKPTRVRYETRDDGSKVRLSARTGKQIGPELKKAR